MGATGTGGGTRNDDEEEEEEEELEKNNTAQLEDAHGGLTYAFVDGVRTERVSGSKRAGDDERIRPVISEP